MTQAIHYILNIEIKDFSPCQYVTIKKFIFDKYIYIFYAIPDILLKMALNTNKTGHHLINYTSHIVESGVKHQ